MKMFSIPQRLSFEDKAGCVQTNVHIVSLEMFANIIFAFDTHLLKFSNVPAIFISISCVVLNL